MRRELAEDEPDTAVTALPPVPPAVAVDLLTAPSELHPTPTIIAQSAPVEHLPSTAYGDEPTDTSLGDALNPIISDLPQQQVGDEQADSPQVDGGAPVTHDASRRLPINDSADPDDPSSRLFRRQLPSRSTRYAGAYYCDPTTANLQQAIRNAICMAIFTHDTTLLWGCAAI